MATKTWDDRDPTRNRKKAIEVARSSWKHSLGAGRSRVTCAKARKHDLGDVTSRRMFAAGWF